MQFSFSMPKVNELDRYLESRTNLDFIYPFVGASKGEEKVKGYDNDENKVYLGKGEAVWENAKIALKAWKQFPSPWTKVYPNTTKFEVGNTVVVLIKLFGVWWVNAARIVYTFDNDRQFGFAYGTIKGHLESGEELFLIERNDAGEIYYRIKAFSKPAVWFVWFGYPVARFYQKKFVIESKETMFRLANLETVK